MANYNSGKLYNREVPEGGAIYNSGVFHLVLVEDIIKTTVNMLLANEISMTDSIEIRDDITNINSTVEIKELVNCIDKVGIAPANFLIDSNGVLQPLGVFVSNDSRYELFPSIKDNTEEVPGKHGEYYFNSNFGSRALELSVVTKKGLSEIEKLEMQRLFAKFLNTSKGSKSLIFADDINKTYNVKYAGRIGFNENTTWFPFTIPFKMASPYILASFSDSIGNDSYETKNFTAVNNGNVETPLIIRVKGYKGSGEIIRIGSFTLSYTEGIYEGQEVIIDTHLSTATLNGDNVLRYVEGQLPYYLPVGDNVVTLPYNVSIEWRSRWI